MTEQKKVLGRGISSLIPNIPPAHPSPSSSENVPIGAQAGDIQVVQMIRLDEIHLNPRQPRRRFSEQALDELAHSIRQCGVLQPVLVRNTARGYELIAGERRVRAAKRAGLAQIPAAIRRRSSDREQLELALIENLQREDLNPLEEARGYDRLGQEFSLTQEEIARRVGKERSTVSNLLRLLKLPPSVQEMLATGAISAGHARALLSLEAARRQEALAQRIEREGLSVRRVESIVRTMKAAQAAGRRVTDRAAQNPNLRHLADEFQRSLGTRVDILPKGEGGEIRIHFFASDELRRLSDRLLRELPTP